MGNTTTNVHFHEGDRLQTGASVIGNPAFVGLDLEWGQAGKGWSSIHLISGNMDRKRLVEWEQALTHAANDLREIIMEIDRRDPEVVAETAKVANIEPLPELEMVPMPVDFPGFVTDPYSGASVPVPPEGPSWLSRVFDAVNERDDWARGVNREANGRNH
jgi:hypothetical protein